MAPNFSVFGFRAKKEQAQANFRSGKGRNKPRAQLILHIRHSLTRLDAKEQR